MYFWKKCGNAAQSWFLTPKIRLRTGNKLNITKMKNWKQKQKKKKKLSQKQGHTKWEKLISKSK